MTWGGYTTRIQLIDAPMGILIVLALSSIGVYGIMLAGWASGSKYPLLGLGPGLGTDDLVRGRTRSEPRSRAADGGHAHHVGHRRQSRRGHELAHRVDRLHPVRHLSHRHDRRAQPATVRPRRGRTRARRRFQHRVQLDPFRTVLPGRVHERDHDERRDGHVVPRRSPAAQARQTSSSDGSSRTATSSHGPGGSAARSG